MIKINLSPIVADANSIAAIGYSELTASVTGAVLTVNGTDYDLSELPDGATAQHEVLGTVTRNGDDYELTLRLPHPPQDWQVTDTDETGTHYQRGSESQRFPQPVIVTTDGVVELPQPEVKTEAHPEPEPEPLPEEPTE